MRAIIDPGKCNGHGLCHSLSPDLFAADEDGYGHVLHDGHVPRGLEDEARRAVANCPESAIAVVDDEAAG